MADPSRLYGLKALVINAAGGIGEASARTLVKHGAKVLAVDSRSIAASNSTSGLSKASMVYRPILMDATRMPALIEQATEHLGSH